MLLGGWLLSGQLLGGCDSASVPELPAAVGRPEGVSQGPRVAMVVAVRGGAEIQPSQGLAFAAAPEQQLLRDDRIVTPPGSLVVVVLHNQHVVRLQPGTLRVDAIAAFAEPPASEDLEQRFAKLLSPEERADPEIGGAIVRVAGWNTRMTAAETIAPLPPPALDARRRVEVADEAGSHAPEEEDLSGASADEAGGAGRITDKRSPEAPVEAKKSETTRPRDPAKNRPPNDDDASNANNPFDPPGHPTGESPGPDAPQTDPMGSPNPPQTKAPDDKRSSSALDLPEQVNFRPDAPGKLLRVSLPAPLVAVREPLAACVGAGGKLRVHVVGHEIVAVEINGAASKCAAKPTGKVGLDDGWIELQVK